MSKMACAEAIYDFLVEEGHLGADDDRFEDIYNACFCLAGRGEDDFDVVKCIARYSPERSEAQISADICDYFRQCGNVAEPECFLTLAIVAGRAVL